jgi:hypothetical protein
MACSIQTTHMRLARPDGSPDWRTAFVTSPAGWLHSASWLRVADPVLPARTKRAFLLEAHARLCALWDSLHLPRLPLWSASLCRVARPR